MKVLNYLKNKFTQRSIESITLAALLELRENVLSGNPPCSGICYACICYLDNVVKHSRRAKIAAIFRRRSYYLELKLALIKLFVLWPKYSGFIEYPVKGAEEFHKNPEYRYFEVESEGGRLRLELLEFMIKELEDECK